MSEYQGPSGMTVLPESSPRPVSVGATPDAFGAPQGEGFSKIGAAEQQLSDVLTNHAVQMAQLDNKAKSDAAWQDTLGKTIGPMYGDYQNTQGANAHEGYKPFADSLEEARKAGGDTLTNPQQHELYDEYSRRMTGYMLENAASHAATERRQFIQDTHTAKIQELTQAGSAASSDEQFQDSQKALAQEMIEQGHHMGEPEIKTQQNIATAQSANWRERLLNMGLQAPDQAQAQFRAHIGELTPQDQLTVGRSLHAYSEATDIQNQIQRTVHGTNVTADPDKIFGALIDEESSGRPGIAGPVTAHGQAHGLTQLLDGTGQDMAIKLGLPWKPELLRGDSPQAAAYQQLLGKEYYTELLQKYGNPAVALAAYNAGPSRVDSWLPKNGDPSQGQVSTADWINKIPFPETKKYVGEILTKAGGVSVPVPPTSENPQEMLPQWIAQAEQGPDPVYNAKVVAGLKSYANGIATQQRQARQAASNTLLTALDGGQMGTDPKPTSIEQLFALSGTKAAYGQLDAKGRETVLKHLNDNAMGPKADTPATLQHYDTLKGMATQDPLRFSNVDLMHEADLTQTERKRLQGIQLAQKKDQTHLESALKVASNIPGVPPKYDPNNRGKGPTDQWNHFTGRFTDELQNFIDTRKREPNDQDIRNITTSIVQQKPDGSGLFGTGTKPEYELHPSAPRAKPQAVPERDALDITNQFFKAYNRRPSEYEIGQIYGRHQARAAQPQLQSEGSTDLLRSGGSLGGIAPGYAEGGL